MVTPLPAESFTVKVTVGALPATPLSTLRMLATMPGRVADSVGTVCAPLMEASNSSSPCGKWHWVHWLSETCGRLTWLAPVAKLTLSWQAPQAARLGFVSQLLACVAPATDVGSWQNAQRRGSEGNTTADQSDTALWYPTTWYGLAGISLGG